MNKYNSDKHHRKSIRLKGYDYSKAGLYFITICCYGRKCIFGEIINGEMVLNNAGKIAHQFWSEIPHHFPNVIIHEFVIMPNHTHGIIELVGANHHSPQYEINNPKEIPKEETTKDEVNKNKTDEVCKNKTDEVNKNKTDEVNKNKTDEVCKNKTDEVCKNKTDEDNKTTKDEVCKNKTDEVNKNKTDEVCKNNPKKRFIPRSPSKTIGSIVRGFKIGVTKWMRQNTNEQDVWQRNYHEHIIRNEQAYQRISNYIINNPKEWGNDTFNKK
jgi:putative transposase